MLYSPDSSNVGDTLSERYEYAQSQVGSDFAQGGNDFTLYNQNAQMGHHAHPMMQAPSDQSARYRQLQQNMFPSLEQERVFQGMPYTGQPQGHYLPRDMKLEFME
jgi:hypothetical protein